MGAKFTQCASIHQRLASTGIMADLAAPVFAELRIKDSPGKSMDTYLEFASNHMILVTALVVSFLFLIFSELRRKAGGITNIEPQEAVGLINADAVVIDLRSADAFSRGHIVNSKNIPFDELEANREKLGRMASKAILAVCDAGVNSSRAVTSLRKSGIESVYGLKGGIAAWTQANLPLVTGKKTKSRK